MHKPKDYIGLADDHHLSILREIYASDDGLADTDGNAFPINIRGFSFSDDVTIEDFSLYGGFNPFIEEEFDAWLEGLHARSFFVGDGDYSEDPDTGRPRIEESIDRVPTHRNPGTLTYSYPLSEWNVDLIGDSLQIYIEWSEEDDVLAPNDEYDVLAHPFLARKPPHLW